MLALALGPLAATGSDPYKGTRTPLKAPDCIADASQSFFADDVPQSELQHVITPAGRFYAIGRYLGASDALFTTDYDFGRFDDAYPIPALRGLPLTGMKLAGDVRAAQRTWQPDGDADTSSALQLQCDEFGSYINTWTFPYRALVGEGPHAVYGYDFPAGLAPPLYDADPATDVVLEADVEIPWLATFADPAAPLPIPPIGQVTLFFYALDRVSGKPLAVLIEIFDNRYTTLRYPEPRAMHDTEVPFLSIPLNPVATFATPNPKSSYFTGTPWSGLRLFSVRVTQAQFRSGIAAINALCGDHRDYAWCEAQFVDGSAYSDDVSRYDLTSFGLLHEVFGTDDRNHLSMGVHAKGLGMWRLR